MDANIYLLLFFAALFVLSLVGVGLTLLIPEREASGRPAVVRRIEPAAEFAVRASCCRYRVETDWRDHFYNEVAHGHRNRMRRIWKRHAN